MNILITGATGYIGSNIVNRLVKQKNDNIFIIAREQSDFHLLEKVMNKINILIYNNDLDTLINFFEESKIDLVIHLAAYATYQVDSKNIDRLIDSNIKFSTHVYQAMCKTNVKKIINTSTQWQNYNNEEYNPICLYAATKKASEDLLYYYTKEYAINTITLSINDTYGPNDNRNKIVSLLQNIAVTKENLCMTKGEQQINLVYIDDIVDAYIVAIKILESKQSIEGYWKKYYLRTEEVKTLKEIVQIFEIIFMTNLNISWGLIEYKKREIMTVYMGEEVLPGWHPNTTIEQGLRKIKELQKGETV